MGTKQQLSEPIIHPLSRRLVPAKVAADRLGLTIWGLRAMAYQGRIASHKIGVRLMISEDEINRTIAESERPRFRENVV